MPRPAMTVAEVIAQLQTRAPQETCVIYDDATTREYELDSVQVGAGPVAFIFTSI